MHRLNNTHKAKKGYTGIKHPKAKNGTLGSKAISMKKDTAYPYTKAI